MLKKYSLLAVSIFVCLLLFTSCDNKQSQQTLDQLEQAQESLKQAQAEAEKWEKEYEKLYVVNQNLEGQLKAEKNQTQQLVERINRDQLTIEQLRKQLENK